LCSEESIIISAPPGEVMISSRSRPYCSVSWRVREVFGEGRGEGDEVGGGEFGKEIGDESSGSGSGTSVEGSHANNVLRDR
jgi:hypothetical protein